MKEKILLLEDDQALGMILSERLRNEGYQVEIVSDSAHPFPQASARWFDLIILDTTLSGLSRVEVCRDMREAGLTSPVLVLIARGQTSQAVLALTWVRMTASRNHWRSRKWWPALTGSCAGCLFEKRWIFIVLA